MRIVSGGVARQMAARRNFVDVRSFQDNLACQGKNAQRTSGSHPAIEGNAHYAVWYVGITAVFATQKATVD